MFCTPLDEHIAYHSSNFRIYPDHIWLLAENTTSDHGHLLLPILLHSSHLAIPLRQPQMPPLHLACKSPSLSTSTQHSLTTPPTTTPTYHIPHPTILSLTIPPPILTHPIAPPLHIPPPPPPPPPPPRSHALPTSHHAHPHPPPRTRLHVPQEQRHIRHRRRHRPLTSHRRFIPARAMEAACFAAEPQ